MYSMKNDTESILLVRMSYRKLLTVTSVVSEMSHIMFLGPEQVYKKSIEFLHSEQRRIIRLANVMVGSFSTKLCVNF
jgi:hypothetical protein